MPAAAAAKGYYFSAAAAVAAAKGYYFSAAAAAAAAATRGSDLSVAAAVATKGYYLLAAAAAAAAATKGWDLSGWDLSAAASQDCYLVMKTTRSMWSFSVERQIG